MDLQTDLRSPARKGYPSEERTALLDEGPPTASPKARFELLESKLLPPPADRATVSRAELIGSLDGPPAPPLVLLSAGPGWGKTMLLAQWAERSERPFAWLSIDAGDNDPIVLLTYVANALDRISPLPAGVFEALTSPGVSVEGTVVPRLGVALTTMEDAVVLVIDDLHLLESPVCLDAIAALTRHVPEGSQLVLSSRSHPPLPLGALRARSLVVELGPNELSLDVAEARQLLSATGLEPTDAEVAEVVDHTEGWSAGVYLAALSAKVSRTGMNGVTGFRGDDRFVAEYLVSELLSRLPRDELLFLTRTAVLEPMSGELCDAVLEGTGSATLLRSLADSNLFVVPLDRTGEWYRYHHLFRELLRSELERAEPDLVPRLLARAADWCEANGQPEAAIGYAQDAGDVDRAARLVVLCGLPVYQSGRAATAERWLGWLESHGALEQNAALAVLGALLATVWGRPAEADRWADAAASGSYEGALPDGSGSIDAWLALLRAQRCRGGAVRMRADAELAVRTLARGSPFWPHALGLVAISRWLTGDGDEADGLFSDVVEAALELPDADVATVALGERAALALARGAWVQGEEHADVGAPDHRAVRDRGPPDERAGACRRSARGAEPRRWSRRGRPHGAGAAPAAAAHVRDAVLRGADAPRAGAGLSDARRCRGRRDRAARGRRRAAPATGPRQRCRLRWTSCVRAWVRSVPTHPGSPRSPRQSCACCPTSRRTCRSARSATACSSRATP